MGPRAGLDGRKFSSPSGFDPRPSNPYLVIVPIELPGQPYIYEPIPVAARSKASGCGRSLVRIAGSNPTLGHGCVSLASFVCCQAEVSASGLSLVQRGPSNCGASECGREASIIRKPWPTGGLSFHKKNICRLP